MRTILIFILGLVSFYSLQAQKIKFGALQQIGLCFNEEGTGLNFTVSNGIRFGRFYTGIGGDITLVSLSRFNNAAFYLDGRYYLNKKQSFFTKANVGTTVITERMQNDYYLFDYNKRPGLYAAGGIGYKAKLGNEVFYTFDISYTMRQTRYSYSYQNFMPNRTETIKHDLRQFAIVVNMGLEF